MSCWDILGILPTTNVDDIKKAFSSMSKTYHPEDDPTRFQQLRTAYQQAIWLAKTQLSESFTDLISTEAESQIQEPAKPDENNTPADPLPSADVISFERSEHFRYTDKDFYEEITKFESKGPPVHFRNIVHKIINDIQAHKAIIIQDLLRVFVVLAAMAIWIILHFVIMT